MSEPRLSRLEFQIMEALWAKGDSSIREIKESFPEKRKPAYTNIQTNVYRMEAKGVVPRPSRAIRPSEGLSTICWPSSEAAHSLSWRT